MLLPAMTGSGVSVLVTARLACASGVQVAPLATGGPGSVVSTPPAGPPVKVTAPRVQTCVVPAGVTGVSIVAWNMIVTVLPAGRLNGPTLTMPPENIGENIPARAARLARVCPGEFAGLNNIAGAKTRSSDEDENRLSSFVGSSLRPITLTT